MRDVYVLEDNIISPLGLNTAENIDSLKKNISAVREIEDKRINDTPFFASLFHHDFPLFNELKHFDYTRFEKLLIKSIAESLKNSAVNPSDPRTILIISSTKGNVELLETNFVSDEIREKISLAGSGKKVAQYFNFVNTPIIVSSACISGVVALITGMRFIQSAQYDHAVVVGADIITKFVLSGFQSFQALSDNICKPFDKNRKGINLGEGAATIILSCKPKETSHQIKLRGGATSNDANHISGPSRTGEELFQAMDKSMKQASLDFKDIDYISAHGTATIFNDEMEANAINLAELQAVPVNSLKGYWGHSLGAAGLMESVAALHAMKGSFILPTLGFEELGVSLPINVCNKTEQKHIRNCIKTVSGFGGCNAAIVFSQE